MDKNYKMPEIENMKNATNKLFAEAEDFIEKQKEIQEQHMTEEELIRTKLNCNPIEFVEKYDAFKKAEKEFYDIFTPFKESLLEMHKTTDLPKSIAIGKIKATYVEPSIRTILDSKKLKEEEPELYKKFIKTTEVSATLKLSEIE